MTANHFIDILGRESDAERETAVIDLSGRDLGRILTVVDEDGEPVRGELVDVKHRLGLRSVIGINTGKTWSWRNVPTDTKVFYDEEEEACYQAAKSSSSETGPRQYGMQR